MKILITKCKNCGCIISGKVVWGVEDTPLDDKYRYELYDVESETNKKGFNITGCQCFIKPASDNKSGLSDYELHLEKIVDNIKGEPSTLKCINLLKHF